jgi:hypothetical protein
MELKKDAFAMAMEDMKVAANKTTWLEYEA